MPNGDGWPPFLPPGFGPPFRRDLPGVPVRPPDTPFAPPDVPGRGFLPPVVVPVEPPPPVFTPSPRVAASGAQTGARQAAARLATRALGGPLAGAVFAIEILRRIGARKEEMREEEEEAKRQFEREQRALRRPTRVIEIPGPPLDVPLPQSVPQIKPVILPEIETAPPSRVPLETQPLPVEIEAPTAPQIEVSPQIEIETPTLPSAVPATSPQEIALPPLATPGFGPPTEVVIPEIAPPPVLRRGLIRLPQTQTRIQLADLVGAQTFPRTVIGDLTPLRIPEVEFPTLAQPLPLAQPQPTRQAEEKCQEVKRRRRRKGVCREGFFREFPGKTQFVTWRERECVTGFKISEK